MLSFMVVGEMEGGGGLGSSPMEIWLFISYTLSSGSVIGLTRGFDVR